MNTYFDEILSREHQAKYESLLPMILPMMGLFSYIRILGTVQKRLGRKESTLEKEIQMYSALAEEGTSKAERTLLQTLPSFLKTHITHILPLINVRATVDIPDARLVNDVVSFLLNQPSRWQYVSTWRERLEYEWKMKSTKGAGTCTDLVTTKTVPTLRGLDIVHYVKRSLGQVEGCFDGTRTPSCPSHVDLSADPRSDSVHTTEVVADLLAADTAHRYRNVLHPSHESLSFLRSWVPKDTPSPSWTLYKSFLDQVVRPCTTTQPRVVVEAFVHQDIQTQKIETVQTESVTLIREKQFVQRCPDPVNVREIQWTITVQCTWRAKSVSEVEVQSWSRAPDTQSILIEAQNVRFALMSGMSRFGEMNVCLPLLSAVRSFCHVLQVPLSIRPLDSCTDWSSIAFMCRSTGQKLDRIHIRAERLAAMIGEKGDHMVEEAPSVERKTRPGPKPYRNAQRIRSLLSKKWGVAYACPALAKRPSQEVRVLTRNTLHKLLKKQSPRQ